MTAEHPIVFLDRVTPREYDRARRVPVAFSHVARSKPVLPRKTRRKRYRRVNVADSGPQS